MEGIAADSFVGKVLEFAPAKVLELESLAEQKSCEYRYAKQQERLNTAMKQRLEPTRAVEHRYETET